MCLGGITISVVEPLVFGKLLKSQHPVTQILTISVIISIPITVFLVALNTGLEFNWSVMNWVLQFMSVIVISLIIVIGRYLVVNIIGSKKIIKAEADPISVESKFLERLPVKYRSATLLAISSEGHYLRVHTDRGSTLILMRISDAIRELALADGLQVHRSWWVARRGVDEAIRKNGRQFLNIKTGETVPVSRSFLPDLKAANLDK